MERKTKSVLSWEAEPCPLVAPQNKNTSFGVWYCIWGQIQTNQSGKQVFCCGIAFWFQSQRLLNYRRTGPPQNNSALIGLDSKYLQRWICNDCLKWRFTKMQNTESIFKTPIWFDWISSLQMIPWPHQDGDSQPLLFFVPFPPQPSQSWLLSDVGLALRATSQLPSFHRQSRCYVESKKSGERRTIAARDISRVIFSFLKKPHFLSHKNTSLLLS